MPTTVVEGLANTKIGCTGTCGSQIEEGRGTAETY